MCSTYWVDDYRNNFQQCHIKLGNRVGCNELYIAVQDLHFQYVDNTYIYPYFQNDHKSYSQHQLCVACKSQLFRLFRTGYFHHYQWIV